MNCQKCKCWEEMYERAENEKRALAAERDKAREQLDVMKDALCRSDVIAADRLQERDQLCKVADELASSEKCPNCDDVGWFTGWRRTVGGDPEPEQCQCEFCYSNAKSRFSAAQSYNSLPHVIERNKTTP